MSDEINRIMKAAREFQVPSDVIKANEARARIAADNALPIERVRAVVGVSGMIDGFVVGSPRGDGDHDFLVALHRQLSDAVTFLPPAMRASFHGQVGALIRLASTVCDINHARAIAGIERVLDDWRTTRAEIAERTR